MNFKVWFFVTMFLFLAATGAAIYLFMDNKSKDATIAAQGIPPSTGG